MNTWSSKKQSVSLADVFGNISVSGTIPGAGFLQTALPQKLYQLYPAVSVAGTDPRVSVPDPEIARLKAMVSALDREVAHLRKAFEAKHATRTVALSTLGDERYRLRQPLWAELDATGEGVTAHISELEEYGAGATEYEALEDLRSVLVETYTFLIENEADLGPAPRKQLQRFRDLADTL